MRRYSEILCQYRGEMSDAEVLNAIECIYRNSRELLEDATLLFDNRRYARAVSLAILAVEERIKSLWLISYYKDQHDPEHHKEFWAKYRSHTKKMEHYYGSLSLRITSTEEISEDEAKLRAADRNIIKQSGLYADCYEAEGSLAGSSRGLALWMAPSELHSETSAKAQLQLASNLIGDDAETIDELTSFARKALAAIDQELEGSPEAFWNFLVEEYEQACKREFERHKQRRIEELKNKEAQ